MQNPTSRQDLVEHFGRWHAQDWNWGLAPDGSPLSAMSSLEDLSEAHAFDHDPENFGSWGAPAQMTPHTHEG